MKSFSQTTLADLLPKTETNLLKLLQGGNCSPTTFRFAIKQLEKKSVSVEMRAAQRLQDLFEQVKETLNESQDRYRTLKEWDSVRKVARKGVRLSRVFKVSGINYPSFFEAIHDTAVYMVANKKTEKLD